VLACAYRRGARRSAAAIAIAAACGARDVAARSVIAVVDAG